MAQASKLFSSIENETEFIGYIRQITKELSIANRLKVEELRKIGVDSKTLYQVRQVHELDIDEVLKLMKEARSQKETKAQELIAKAMGQAQNGNGSSASAPKLETQEAPAV